MAAPRLDAIPFRSAATVSGVREVSLRARADLRFWERELSPLGLAPVDRDGQAWLQISAIDARFLGLRFQELALSVEVAPPERPDGSQHAFFWQGWSSRRFFAWVERRRFQTPYDHGMIRMIGEPPAGIEAHLDGRLAFHAAISAEPGDLPRVPLRSGDETWSGRIHLPIAGAGPRHCFFAHLTGPARVIAFDPARDAFTIATRPRPAAIEKLAASAATGAEWLIRTEGLHARSKTCRRDDPPPR